MVTTASPRDDNRLLLQEWQTQLKAALSQRGFDDESIEQKFLLFTEEVGELAKAIRKTAGIKTAPDASLRNLHEEIGDVFILLVDICNKLDIDLESAVRLKEAINSQRTWE